MEGTTTYASQIASLMGEQDDLSTQVSEIARRFQRGEAEASELTAIQATLAGVKSELKDLRALDKREMQKTEEDKAKEEAQTYRKQIEDEMAKEATKADSLKFLGDVEAKTVDSNKVKFSQHAPDAAVAAGYTQKTEDDSNETIKEVSGSSEANT